MLPFYSAVICVIAAVLFVAVNEHEPSRRVASALKVLIVTLAVAAIVGHLVSAFAQKQGTTKTAPKPTIAQVRKLVQTISSNKGKLKVFCNLNQLDKQLEEAEQRKDSQGLEALNAQADSLERKISPEYTQVMDGLELIDPNSADGKQATAAIDTLTKQCK